MPYSFSFTSNEAYRYDTGALFLGVDPEEKYEVGMRTERHAITVAGARAGKGAAIIIPNLLRWPHNAIVIDPKGEAAEATAEARERRGQAVHVLDPFMVANVPDRFRAKLNPLTGFDANALDARESINVIADGLVLRTDPKAAHWDSGGQTIVAGLIADMLERAPVEARNLPELRKVLMLPREERDSMARAMQRSKAFGGLAAGAASKLLAEGNEARGFISVAESATDWLTSPAMADFLSGSSFDLADLKTKPCTVYLVLPAHLMGEHGRFLRLFVRMALNVMARGGVKGGRRCLFLLDEFYSLGRIDEIAKAAGLMPGYGVTLMPILQDLGQLESLYGRDGMHTFFGSADAHIFFGISDALTLDYVSARVGKVTVAEIAPPPESLIVSVPGDFRAPIYSQHAGIEYNNIMNVYNHEKVVIGHPRMAPDQVREHVRKSGVVAGAMIVFAQGSDILSVEPAPYFIKIEPKPQPAPVAPVPVRRQFYVSYYLNRLLSKLEFQFQEWRWPLVSVAAGWIAYAGSGGQYPVLISLAVAVFILVYRLNRS